METVKEKINNMVSELQDAIQTKEMEVQDIIKDVPGLTKLVESNFEKLKSLISDYQFPSPEEEIIFFKDTKPKIFSKLIYYRKVYYFELNRPVCGFEVTKTYIMHEHSRIQSFYERNAAFIKYYRSGKTLLDKLYFLREKKECELNLENFYFDRDPKFSTSFDFKVAKLLANDMLAAYLNIELAKLERDKNSINTYDCTCYTTKWTDKKNSLAELVYGIATIESVNNGNIEIKTLAAIFGKIFNIDMGDIYHTYLAIKARKGERLVYLRRMIDLLDRRMIEDDCK